MRGDERPAHASARGPSEALAPPPAAAASGGARYRRGRHRSWRGPPSALYRGRGVPAPAKTLHPPPSPVADLARRRLSLATLDDEAAPLDDRDPPVDFPRDLRKRRRDAAPRGRSGLTDPRDHLTDHKLMAEAVPDPTSRRGQRPRLPPRPPEESTDPTAPKDSLGHWHGTPVSMTAATDASLEARATAETALADGGRWRSR